MADKQDPNKLATARRTLAKPATVLLAATLAFGGATFQPNSRQAYAAGDAPKSAPDDTPKNGSKRTPSDVRPGPEELESNRITSDQIHNVDPELRKQINSAIDKGISAIKNSSKDGTWKDLMDGHVPTDGQHWLTVYTILCCDRNLDIKSVLRAFESDTTKQRDGRQRLYAQAVKVLAYSELIQKIEERFKDNPRKKIKTAKLKMAIKNEIKAIARLQRGKGKKGAGGWRYSKTRDLDSPTDMSATQYALLAYRAASQIGVKVPRRSLELALKYLLDNQEQSGPKFRLQYAKT